MRSLQALSLSYHGLEQSDMQEPVEVGLLRELEPDVSFLLQQFGGLHSCLSYVLPEQQCVCSLLVFRSFAISRAAARPPSAAVLRLDRLRVHTRAFR